MLDKDWLNRVTTAYNVYAEQFGNKKTVEDFITWLYGQYGVVEPKKEKNEV